MNSLSCKNCGGKLSANDYNNSLILTVKCEHCGSMFKKVEPEKNIIINNTFDKKTKTKSKTKTKRGPRYSFTQSLDTKSLTMGNAERLKIDALSVNMGHIADCHIDCTSAQFLSVTNCKIDCTSIQVVGKVTNSVIDCTSASIATSENSSIDGLSVTVKQYI